MIHKKPPIRSDRGLSCYPSLQNKRAFFFILDGIGEQRVLAHSGKIAGTVIPIGIALLDMLQQN